jgi:hypothetical protein
MPIGKGRRNEDVDGEHWYVWLEMERNWDILCWRLWSSTLLGRNRKVHQSQQIENDEDLKILMARGVISPLVLSWSKLLSLRNAGLTVYFIGGEAGHAILRNFNHLVSSSLRSHLVISLLDWLPASIDMMEWNAKQHWQVFHG